MKTFIAALLLIILYSSQLFGQEVILIRHAKVYLNHSGWMNSKKAAEYREAYDTAPIHQFNPEKVLAEIPKRITDTIYVSGLPRSIGTGIKLFGSTANIVSLDMLNEFELHIVWLPLYLPYKVWAGISRSMWLLGTERKGTESYREAKKRVSLAADFIEEKSITQKQIILVTHGFFNRNLAKELKKRDWEIIRNEGKENLGSTILKK